LEEGPKLLAFLLGVRWIPTVVCRLADEEVRYEDLVLMMLIIGMSKDIRALV
jgi:hypothetical protein